MRISIKSIARIAIIQTLYKFASSKGTPDINSLLVRIKKFYKDMDLKSDHDIDQKSMLKLEPSYSCLDELVKCTHDLVGIDTEMSRFLTRSWTITNLPMLLHAALRVEICELAYFPETPKKVIINEYTDIANDMLGENGIGFVN